MGRARNKRMRTTKKKDYKKIHCTARRRRDIDQIQDDVVNTQAGKPLVFDELTAEDLPGLGQFYCLTCARHFLDDQTLKAHEEGRPHKRRLKDVAQPQYSQSEADRAAGKTKEQLPSAKELREKIESRMA